jgi:hypothetical protein
MRGQHVRLQVRSEASQRVARVGQPRPRRAFSSSVITNNVTRIGFDADTHGLHRRQQPQSQQSVEAQDPAHSPPQGQCGHVKNKSAAGETGGGCCCQEGEYVAESGGGGVIREHQVFQHIQHSLFLLLLLLLVVILTESSGQTVQQLSTHVHIHWEAR